MTEAQQTILYSVDEGVARITLNRPEKKNALNDQLVSDLMSALRTTASDHSVRVLVITGAGSDFCAGADLSALEKISQASVAENAADARALMEVFVFIRQMPMPVVAAVRGRALAGGCGLATACDLVLASPGARFGYPEVKIGFVPAMVMAILRRNVSEKRAFALITRGAEIDAAEAERIGLINAVLPEESFDDAVAQFLRPLQSASQSAITLTKQLLYQMDGMAFLAAIEAGVDINVIARLTEDCRQGVERFLNRSRQ
jgi:methylglutaconyl-CoA hydratase